MAICTALIKDMSSRDAKELLHIALFVAIAFTILCAGYIGVAVLNYVLQKVLINKIIGATGAFLPLVLIPLLWQFYFCVKKRASEGDAVS